MLNPEEMATLDARIERLRRAALSPLPDRLTALCVILVLAIGLASIALIGVMESAL